MPNEIIGYKVVKGVTLEKAELDSTFPDKKRANDRRDTLKRSLRTKRISVWVVPMTETDPHHYRKPRKSPY